MAIFIPSVDLEGHLNINMRVDKRMLAALNVPGIFTGSIKDSGNIGKTSQELAELWNEEYPDNPIENKEEERRI